MDTLVQQFQGLVCATLLLLAQLQSAVCRYQDVLGITQQHLFLLQFAELVLLQVQGVEFLHLVGQQLHAAGVLIPGARQQLEFATLAQPVGSVLLNRLGERPVAGIGIQQVALHRLA